MIRIVGTPERAIPQTAYKSRWVATDAPVLFTLQRVDNVVESQSAGAGLLVLNLGAAPNKTLYPTVGSSVWLHASDTDTFLTARVSVADKSTNRIEVGVDTPYGSPSFEVLKSHTYDFYVGTEDIQYAITAYLILNGAKTSVVLRRTPDSKGRCEVDLSGLLFAEVSDEKVGDYTALNVAETNQSGEFEPHFGELYIGDTDISTINGGSYRYVKAVRSKEKGANMAEFVSNPALPCQFLNYFGEPTHWLGLPFDISFIYSEQLAGKSLKLVEEHYDSANKVLSTFEKNLNAAGLGFVNSINFSPDSIEATCSRVRFGIKDYTPTPPLPTDSDLDVLRKIRDANPQSALVSQWSDDVDPYTQWPGVHWTAAKRVDRLDVSGKNVSSLPNVNRLTLLDVLRFADNKIPTVDVSGLAIAEVSGANNPLTSFNTSGTTNLQFVDLGYCKLPSFDASALMMLLELKLSHNLMTTLTLNANPTLNLRWLSVSFNDLLDIPTLRPVTLGDPKEYYFNYNRFSATVLNNFRAKGYTDESRLTPQKS